MLALFIKENQSYKHVRIVIKRLNHSNRTVLGDVLAYHVVAAIAARSTLPILQHKLETTVATLRVNLNHRVFPAHLFRAREVDVQVAIDSNLLRQSIHWLSLQ